MNGHVIITSLGGSSSSWIILKTSQHTHTLMKWLRISEKWGILNKSWDSWLYSFPLSAPQPPHPCPTRTSRTSHWEIFPGSVFVANPDWLPPTMGRRLVVPLTLANTMCLCTKYSDPLKKDQDQTSTFSPFHWDGKACICCNSDDLGLSWSYVFCDQNDWGCWKGIQNSELWILWIQNSVLSSPFLNRYKSHLQIFLKELFLPIKFWSVFLYPDHLTSQMCFKQWPRCYRKRLEVKDEEEGERVEDGGTWHSQAGEQFTKCFSNLHAPLRPCLPCPWKVGRYQPRAGLRSSPRFFGFQSSILLYLTLSTADFCIFAGFSGQQVGNL